MLTEEIMQRERRPQAMAKVVVVAHKAHLGWADMVCIAAEDALPVRAVSMDGCRVNYRSGYQDGDEFASALDDAGLILLYGMDGMDFDTALAMVHVLRSHCVHEPLLLVNSVHDEEELLRAYAAGVDECIHASVGLALLLAKLRAWLRWAPNGPGFAASPGSPC